MRKELLCVLGGLLAACGVQAQQAPGGYAYPTPYYQEPLQPVQMAPGAGYGGYNPGYYPNNYGYVPSYPANYGYGANSAYGNYDSAAGYGYAASPNGAGVQIPANLPAATGPVVTDPGAGAVAAPASSAGAEGAPNKTFWISADYLLGSIQRGPLRFPLVTVGSAADAIPGALGQANTSVAFGANNLDIGLSHGIHAEAGLFLDADRMFSVDVSGFILFPDKINTVFASNSMGLPVIARPYINTVGGILRAEQSSLPPLFSGSTTVDTESKLYGFEANARCNGRLSSNWDADFLGGFRYVRLEESLMIGDRITPIPPSNPLLFQGQPVDPMSTLMDQDSFSTSNTFYGLNLGGRLRWQRDWFFVTGFAKVALGVTEEKVRIAGSTTLSSPGGSQTAVGGILALPSNIGNYNRSTFGVVPETGLTLGVQPIQHVRLTAGYSLLYWNAVARPGDQIDPRLNRTQIPGDSTFGQPGGAGSNPVFQFQDRSFRVHNLTAGLEIYY